MEVFSSTYDAVTTSHQNSLRVDWVPQGDMNRGEEPEPQDKSAVCQLPDNEGVVIGTTGQVLPVRRKGQGIDGTAMSIAEIFLVDVC